MRFLLALLVWVLASWLPAAAEPQKVQVGMFLSNVNDIDLKTCIYTADFYVWYRWTGDIDPAATTELMNVVEQWGTTEKALYSAPEVLPSGEKYQLVRIQGKFNNKFPLHAYPLDNQDVVIELENLSHSRDEIVYVADQAETSFNPGIRLPGWTLHGHTFAVEDYRYPTKFGLPPSHQRTSAYSRIVFRLHLGRPVLSYTFKMLVPVLIVLCSTFAIFWLGPSQIDSRVSIAITALLSAVALNITVVSNLPLVGYQVLVDKIYNLTYVVVFLALLAAIGSVRLENAGDHEQALALDRTCYRLLPLFFLVGTALLIATR